MQSTAETSDEKTLKRWLDLELKSDKTKSVKCTLINADSKFVKLLFEHDEKKFYVSCKNISQYSEFKFKDLARLSKINLGMAITYFESFVKTLKYHFSFQRHVSTTDSAQKCFDRFMAAGTISEIESLVHPQFMREVAKHAKLMNEINVAPLGRKARQRDPLSPIAEDKKSDSKNNHAQSQNAIQHASLQNTQPAQPSFNYSRFFKPAVIAVISVGTFGIVPTVVVGAALATAVVMKDQCCARRKK